MNNVENGNIDVVKDTNSTKMGASLPEQKPVDEHFGATIVQRVKSILKRF